MRVCGSFAVALACLLALYHKRHGMDPILMPRHDRPGGSHLLLNLQANQRRKQNLHLESRQMLY